MGDTAQRFAARVRAALETCRANVEAFRSAPEDEDFATRVTAFDRLFEPLAGLGGRVGLFAHAHPDADLREACLALEQEMSELQTDVSLDRGLYERLAAATPEGQEDPELVRVHEHALRDFRRSGVDREEGERARIRELQQELVQIGQSFDLNIIQSSTEFVIEAGHAGLAGLPEDFLASHPEREDGSVAISTDLADRQSFLTYADDGELRRRYHHLCSNLAVPDNLEVLPRLLAKRHELARLLGYACWADYVTEDKMVKSTARARAFVDGVVERARGRAQVEYDELLAEKRRDEPGGEAVEEWERAYLAERVKRRRFRFDSQEARAYFPYARVRDGLLALCAELYGVRIERNGDVEVWHPSVECYDVSDAGRLVARLYLDMHPRPDKYKHGAMFPLASGPGILPEGALVCNFTAPTDSDPGLLAPEEVRTFFHEVGHLLHQLFASAPRSFAFSGIATEFDFVEVPSQLFEEWARRHDVLVRFARHHATDAPIPVELVERMRAAASFGRSLNVMAQMVFATLSLAYYDRDPADLDLTETMVEIKRRLSPSPHHAGTHFQASFGHLHGYSALYYTYMWSLVIAKDVYSRFADDPLDPRVMRAYRETVLAPGGARDAGDLVEAFLGRPYGFDAFEAWLAEAEPAGAS